MLDACLDVFQRHRSDDAGVVDVDVRRRGNASGWSWLPTTYSLTEYGLHSSIQAHGRTISYHLTMNKPLQPGPMIT